MKLRPIIGKLPSHKSFNYTPRYYKPEKDTRRKEIHFERKTHRGQMKSVVFYVLLLTFIIWLIVKIS